MANDPIPPSPADKSGATQGSTPPERALAHVPAAAGDTATRVLLEQLLTTLGSTSQESEDERRGARRWQARTYLAVVRRRLKPMLLAALLVTAAVGWRMRPVDEQYSATAVMLLPFKSTAPGTIDALGILGGIMQASMPNNLNTQIAILTSPGLVEQALAELSSAERLRGWKTTNMKEMVLAARVQAIPGQSADLINLTVTAADEAVAVKLANQMIESYAERSTMLANRSSRKNIKLLSSQVRQSYQLMVKAKEELQAYKEQTGILSLSTRLTSDAEQLQELTVQAQRARETAAAGVGDPSIQGDEQRNQFSQNLRAAQEKYEGVLNDFLPTAPEARMAAREVRQAQAALDLRTRTLLSVNQSRSRDVTGALEAQKRAMANLPAVEVKLDQLQDKVTLLTNTYRQVYDRYTSLSLGQSAQIDTATSLIPAEKALLSSRTWPMILAVALVCGLAASILVASVLEASDNSLHDSEDLRHLVDLPLLGPLPLLPAKSERRLGRMLAGGSTTSGPLLEACRLLRANLLFATEGAARVILITSADAGEGKSLTALNLATAMAMDGKNVLLIDCDLRRPTQHELSEVPQQPGLVDLLSHTGDLDVHLHETLHFGGVTGLSVLTAGAQTSNPPELLGSVENRELLAALKERFDLIILDSPPVLALADTQVLSSLTDGVLLVVAAGSTATERILRAERVLRHSGARVLGTVFNRCQDATENYYQSGYHSKNPAPALGTGAASVRRPL